MTTALLVAVVLALCALLLFVTFAHRRPKAHPTTARRLLVPFIGGALDQSVLAAALRVAHAEDSTLVPAYLLVVPLAYAEDAPLRQEVGVAMPLLEAVEHAALKAGVPVDARIERGRSADARLTTPVGGRGVRSRDRTSTGPGGRCRETDRVHAEGSRLDPDRGSFRDARREAGVNRVNRVRS